MKNVDGCYQLTAGYQPQNKIRTLDRVGENEKIHIFKSKLRNNVLKLSVLGDSLTWPNAFTRMLWTRSFHQITYL